MRPIFAVLAVPLLALPCTALAGPVSVFTFHISAHVNTFCRISAPQDAQIAIVNGAAEIGAVSEICNTPSGYDVTAKFSNLDGGTLNVAGQGYVIDATGTSVRHSNEARVQTVNWQLAGAQLVQPNAPVFMQVTIAPI